MTLAKEQTAPTSDKHEIWRAGDLLIDIGTSTVSRGNHPLNVSGLNFDLLIALVRAAPNYLGHDELIDMVWNGRIVSHETVVQRVKLLRDALGDHANEPCYIGLVKRRGYKFLADVEQLDNRPTKTITGGLAKWSYSVAAATVVLAVIFIFWPERHPATSDAPIRSGIAVLPFSASGTGPGDADFFALGVHDDIITQLANVKDLLVIARTSVLRYKDTQQSVKEIGRKLNVDKILEGTVQRTEDRIKINVQLIDVAIDAHIWAKTYERALDVASILTIQHQIAADVAQALHISLANLPAQTGPPTASMEAYEHYLVARQQIKAAVVQHDGSFNKSNPMYGTLRDAISRLDAAVAADPEFVDAYAYKALVTSKMYNQSVDKDPALLKEAVAALLKAVELDPTAPRTHWARANYLQAVGDFPKSLKELELAAQGLPEDPEILLDLARKYRNRGRLDEALQVAEKVLFRDPLNFEALTIPLDVRINNGDVAGALSTIRQMRALQPGNIRLAYLETQNLLQLNGDRAAFRAAIRKLPIINTPSTLDHWRVAINEQDYNSALTILETHPFDVNVDVAVYAPYSFYKAYTFRLAGERELAIAEWQKARQQLETMLVKNPRDTRPLVTLALTLANLDEKELARETVKKVLESTLYQNIKPITRVWRYYLILTLIQTGDYNDALDLLELQVSDLGPELMRDFIDDSRLDPLRTHPRFQEIAGHKQEHALTDI